MFSPESKPSLIHRIGTNLQNDGLLAPAVISIIIGGTIGTLASPEQQLGSFLHGYGYDVILPLQAYIGSRMTFLESIHRNGFNWLKTTAGAAFIFGGASFLELLQKSGRYEGTYDPYDFIAYGIGAGLALTLDRITFRTSLK